MKILTPPILFHCPPSRLGCEGYASPKRVSQEPLNRHGLSNRPNLPRTCKTRGWRHTSSWPHSFSTVSIWSYSDTSQLLIHESKSSIAILLILPRDTLDWIRVQKTKDVWHRFMCLSFSTMRYSWSTSLNQTLLASSRPSSVKHKGFRECYPWYLTVL